MGIYTVREAKPEEQRELTRLCVRATMHSGYDEEFIDRSMPSLTITLPEISGVLSEWHKMTSTRSSASFA